MPSGPALIAAQHHREPMLVTNGLAEGSELVPDGKRVLLGDGFGTAMPMRPHVCPRLGGGGINTVQRPTHKSEVTTRTTARSPSGMTRPLPHRSASAGSLGLVGHSPKAPLDSSENGEAPRPIAGALPGTICHNQRLRTCPGNASTLARRMLTIKQAASAGAGNPPGHASVSNSLGASALRGEGMHSPSAKRWSAHEKQQSTRFFLARHPSAPCVSTVVGSPCRSPPQLDEALGGKPLAQGFDGLRDSLSHEGIDTTRPRPAK